MLVVKKLLAKILGALKGGYIVDEGTSGSWRYREWSTGFVELDYSASLSVSFATWKNLTYVNHQPPAIPSKYSSISVISQQVTVFSDTISCWAGLTKTGAIRAYAQETGTHTVVFYRHVGGTVNN